MRFTPRTKINLSLSLSLAALAALVVFIIWPSISDIKSLNTAIAEQHLALEQLYQKGRSIKTTLEQYREIEPTVGSLDNIYVKHGDELKLITALEQVAKEQGVDQTLSPASTTATQPANQLSLQLQVAGTLPKLIKYLSAIEALDYYFNIDLVRLSSSATPANTPTNTEPTLSAIFLATTYLKP